MKELFKKIIVTVITWEARAVLHKYKPRVVAITGSVGKTSTKDAVYAVLARKYHVRKSEKSFNSEIGLPLTILGCPNAWGNPLRWLQNIVDGLLLVLLPAKYPEWLVLEVGADRPGDIRSLVGWLRSDVVVITRLPEVPVHVEFFDSPEAVIEEKAALIDTLRQGGVLLLYADDERTRGLEHRLPAPDARIILFGFAEDADVRARDFTLVREEGGPVWPLGMQAHIAYGESAAPLTIMGSVGTHSFAPAVAAAAVGVALQIDMLDIMPALEAYDPPPGRMHLLPGIKKTLIIDDTYNSSPAAAAAALDTLSLVCSTPKRRTKKAGTRRIAVLGDMLELGRLSVMEHRKVGAHAAKTADVLVTVGFRARDIAQGALDAGMRDEQIFQYEDSTRAGRELQNMLQPGDCILVKGSQSTRMERVVEDIMLEPERAGELLVRQDEEWRRR